MNWDRTDLLRVLQEAETETPYPQEERRNMMLIIGYLVKQQGGTAFIPDTWLTGDQRGIINISGDIDLGIRITVTDCLVGQGGGEGGAVERLTDAGVLTRASGFSSPTCAPP